MALRPVPTASATDALAGAPLRVGDHPALDWLNSVFTPVDTEVDLLSDGAALAAWLHAAQVLPPALATAAARLPSADADALAEQARALREWVRPLVQRWSEHGAAALKPADLNRLNALMAASPQSTQLRREGDALRLEPEPAAADAAAILGALAGQCALLFTTCQPEQVRRCENPACTLWFADTKRGPRRRWCSMALCGNRHKVAAHRARQRAAAGG